ncbi:MAG: hypothetical protein EXR99_09055 [Gemmataceae bacterium]|nr:hypothetical protein [Gemmataceae bacterium]
MPFPDHPCPKCNSWIDPPAGTATGEKIVCPRCEDPIIWLGPAIAGIRAEKTDLPSAGLPQANRRVASWVVALMGAMALAALFFALYTRETRRNRDLARAVSDPRQAYLQWLPADASLILVCNLDLVRASQTGEHFLDADAFTQKNLPLRKWIGHDLRELRLAALAALPERPLASLLFLQVNHPLDEQRLVQKMKAIPSGNRGGRETFRFSLEGMPLGPSLAQVGENSLALVILPERLEQLPGNAPGNLDNLRPAVRALVVERVPRLAPVWLAGEGAKLESLLSGEIIPGVTLNPKLPVGRDFFNGVEAFALWLELDPGVTARGEFLFNTEEEARRWDAELGKQPWAATLGLKSALKGRWLTVQGTLPKAWHDLPRRVPTRGKKG